MRQRKPLILLILALLALNPLFAEYLEEPFRILSSRAHSIGGLHAADAYDMGTIFTNPAGFQQVEPQVAFSELTLGLRGPVFDIADVVVQAMAGGGDFGEILGSDSVQSLLSGLYAGMNLITPFYFGYVGDGLGLGIFNNSDVTFQESAPLTLGITLKEELLLAGGYTYRLPLPQDSGHVLDVGLVLKGGLRGSVQITEAFANLMNLDISADTVLNSPFTFTAVIGLDAGVLYSWNDLFSVGITVIDLFSPSSRKTYSNLDAMLGGSENPLTTETGTIPASLNVGVGITPPLGPLERYVSKLSLFVDYNDILGLWLYQEIYRNPWLRLSAGAELTMLEIFSLRGGLNGGLLSAGLGVDLSLFTLNIAMFGTELGSEPGVQPIYNLMLGVEFRY